MESGSAASAGSAADILREARAAGITLSLWCGFIDWRAEQGPAEALLARLREVKSELIEILSGDRCSHCSERLVWSHPGAVAFSDGLGAHLACYERAEVLRQSNAAAKRTLPA